MRGISQGFAIAGILILAQPAMALDPQAVDLGVFKFVPTVKFSQTYDSNIYSQSIHEEDSWITRLSPQFQLIAQQDANVFGFTYSGDYGVYAETGDDNYLDHTLSADAHLEMNSRNVFTLGAAYAMLHDNRGEGSSEGAIALTRGEPDEYDLTTLNGAWDFGAEGAMYALRFSAAATDVEYQNNRLETQFRDRDDVQFGARLYGQIAPKTRLFVDVSQTEISYDTLPLFGPTLDSEEQRVSMGAEWDISGRTSGSVQVGRVEKDFDAVARADAGFMFWNVGFSWAPRTYSVFNVSTSKQPRETNGTGSFIDSTSYDVSWQHGWTSQITSNVGFGLGDDDYPGSTRNDDRARFTIGASYDYDRWLNFSVAYDYNKRDSSNTTFNFTRSSFTFGVHASL